MAQLNRFFCCPELQFLSVMFRFYEMEQWSRPPARCFFSIQPRDILWKSILKAFLARDIQFLSMPRFSRQLQEPAFRSHFGEEFGRMSNRFYPTAPSNGSGIFHRHRFCARREYSSHSRCSSSVRRNCSGEIPIFWPTTATSSKGGAGTKSRHPNNPGIPTMDPMGWVFPSNNSNHCCIRRTIPLQRFSGSARV